MIIYRPHRGGLAEAMKEAREFETIDAMKAHIVASWTEACDGRRPFEPEDIVIDDEAINDPRNGWKDTCYVCITHCFDERYPTPACIGMCATDYPRAE